VQWCVARGLLCLTSVVLNYFPERVLTENDFEEMDVGETSQEVLHTFLMNSLASLLYSLFLFRSCLVIVVA